MILRIKVHSKAITVLFWWLPSFICFQWNGLRSSSSQLIAAVTTWKWLPFFTGHCNPSKGALIAWINCSCINTRVVGWVSGYCTCTTKLPIPPCKCCWCALIRVNFKTPCSCVFCFCTVYLSLAELCCVARVSCDFFLGWSPVCFTQIHLVPQCVVHLQNKHAYPASLDSKLCWSNFKRGFHSTQDEQASLSEWYHKSNLRNGNI